MALKAVTSAISDPCLPDACELNGTLRRLRRCRSQWPSVAADSNLGLPHGHPAMPTHRARLAVQLAGMCSEEEYPWAYDPCLGCARHAWTHAEGACELSV